MAGQVLRLIVWLCVLCAIFLPLERYFAVRQAQPGERQRWPDLFYYFANSLLPMLVLAVPLALVTQLSRKLIPAAVPETLAALPLAQRLLLALLVGDIGAYWSHRLAHHWPPLWRFHAVHHSAAHVYFLTNTRAHPVDLLFTRLCSLAPLYALGLAGPGLAGSATPVAVILVGSVWGFFIHSNLRLRLGPLEWLLSTPAFHHWHHTRHDHVDRNFAAMLPMLDRVFGTHYLPRAWPAEYGSDTVVPSELAGQLAAPFSPAAPAANIKRTEN
ncbi:sterol desaturase family protein [Duganella sp. Root1480D1]|uniref:sterol desaturase family protein n=1 Tax=Duganella sp. Root1480D1 TaxID=1736471 RepID=UPI00070F37D0|nr:sterol desaturase family protein [Duganella sp. Root1480D1]KQZ44268.1 sterol desaturase [Duganella sp. Root1480D1]